ncbi:hypothetical protein Mpe_B0107 (plasmid) [Methylibium petroleiphilum PM1]|uniref:Uncharacterized protein n=1 Tax=Methylibium petroleiphilum (strain ATCC BAA-1232 / LMG 22953 / PM1) TaxID=420662 RepID=A2SMU7_METPP|nr:hypothetical protein Mpe_B0107 [Methylibium petroleiphilum PM1]
MWVGLSRGLSHDVVVHAADAVRALQVLDPRRHEFDAAVAQAVTCVLVCELTPLKAPAAAGAQEPANGLRRVRMDDGGRHVQISLS